MKIIIEDRIKEACPDVRIGLIRAKVVNSEFSEELNLIKKLNRFLKKSNPVMSCFG